MSAKRILVTGGEGYLARQLIKKLIEHGEIELIVVLDPKVQQSGHKGKIVRYRGSVTHRKSVETLIKNHNINSIIHAAWTFNPSHDLQAQFELDFWGTADLLNVAADLGVKQIVYLGSTTCYGQFDGNPSSPPFLTESDWNKNKERRLYSAYPYARNKAIVDEMFQSFLRYHPEMDVFWIRGAIVLGPNTRNIVSYVAESPFTLGLFMFSVRSYDPPMQFISEYDMTEILYRAVLENWRGVANVAGDGVIKYSELIKLIGKKKLVLPAWVLYPVCELLWRCRAIKFPSSLIDLIRFPWVADTSRLKEVYGYHPRDSSMNALRQFLNK